MLKSRVVRGYHSSRLIAIIFVAVSGTVVFINNLLALFSAPPSSVMSTDVRSVNVNVALHSLSASVVRIEGPDPASPGSQVRLVLSVEAADLTDFMDAYRRGFADKVAEYPDDGGFLLHNPELCRGRSLDWVVYIHTSPDHGRQRQLLRDTWANVDLFKHLNFRVVFLLGRPPPASSALQAQINAEFKKHGDLVQGSFIDSYKNLTLKAVLGLRWMSQYCSEAPFAIKTDDDTFLNIFEMVRLMKENANKSRVIICPLWLENAMPILRDPKTCMKWCVKRNELRGRTRFPQYCAGIGYIVSSPLLPLLYNASKSTPFFWIDDVYVTGLLTKKLPAGVVYVDTGKHFTSKEDVAIKQYENRSEPIKYYYVHSGNEEKFMKLWTMTIERLATEQRLMMSDTVKTHFS